MQSLSFPCTPAGLRIEQDSGNEIGVFRDLLSHWERESSRTGETDSEYSSNGQKKPTRLQSANVNYSVSLS